LLRHLPASSLPEMTMTFRPILFAIAALAATLTVAQAQQPQPQPNNYRQQYSTNEIVDTGHRFFGTTSRELALLVERATQRWGQPNGYILGEEAGGAITIGLRYGEGTLYTRNAGDRRVYWQGPSIGFDVGGEGARVMMLVYNLPALESLYNRYVGISGSAYFIGGFGMTAVTWDRVVVVPIRTGVGLRLGANIGYLKFTPTSTWNPL
jgi:hypothetical protein